MGYYAAGGYYSAGGFSFKKLGRFIGKVAAPVLKQVAPALVGLVPGGATVLGGVSLLRSFGAPGRTSAVAALQESRAGTPGHNARMMRRFRMPRRRRRY